jgi:hypothetical protein
MRALGLGFVTVVIIAACGGSSSTSSTSGGFGKTSSGARASCGSDADCTVTNHSGCCKACPEKPFAIPTVAAEQMKNRCAEVECAAPPAGVVCQPVDSIAGFDARCQDGTCTAVKAPR